jgi:hypothetical protein
LGLDLRIGPGTTTLILGVIELKDVVKQDISTSLMGDVDRPFAFDHQRIGPACAVVWATVDVGV